MTDLRSRVVEADDVADPSVIVLDGEIDMATAPAIGATVEARRQAGCVDLTIDLRDVTFIDSQGINELIRAHRALAGDGGALSLRSPSPNVAVVLQIAGVDTVLAIV